ncbi:hypothetical protein DCCM_4262 [Desulfocucumis palustris]|uniref:Uncharacterized protein n=1 Tax=Desulfocucumis palustris TaxID=1898651 RepID=A0A2L2XFL6_9FIRM|nr:hypothetical protein DCCM_4262 [Desulfocucumis palustris]
MDKNSNDDCIGHETGGRRKFINHLRRNFVIYIITIIIFAYIVSIFVTGEISINSTQIVNLLFLLAIYAGLIYVFIGLFKCFLKLRNK